MQLFLQQHQKYRSASRRGPVDNYRHPLPDSCFFRGVWKKIFPWDISKIIAIYFIIIAITTAVLHFRPI
jgi:hypothetical protein